MSIDLRQLRNYVARPTLRYLAESNLMPWTVAAENLVLGTILTESRGQYLKQIGGGPALGIIQMEPYTHDALWSRWLDHPARKPLADRLRALQTSAHITDGALELIGNLYYAVGMCRVFYRHLPDPLPAANDPLSMAQVYKRRYNTALGKAAVESALPHFREACA